MIEKQAATKTSCICQNNHTREHYETTWDIRLSYYYDSVVAWLLALLLKTGADAVATTTTVVMAASAPSDTATVLEDDASSDAVTAWQLVDAAVKTRCERAHIYMHRG